MARACSTPADYLQSHSLHLEDSEAGSHAGSFADLTSLLDAPADCGASEDEYCSGTETPLSGEGAYQDAVALQVRAISAAHC